MICFVSMIKQTVKNIIKPFVLPMMSFVLKYPFLNERSKRAVRHFPKLEALLRRVYSGNFLLQKTDISLLPITPYALKIYENLKTEIEQKKERE